MSASTGAASPLAKNCRRICCGAGCEWSLYIALRSFDFDCIVCSVNVTPRLVLFLSAALILAITPGPGIFYVLARSLRGGRREGMLSAAGTFFGGLVHVGAAAFGLSAILAASAIALETVRCAGGLYLIYLGC